MTPAKTLKRNGTTITLPHEDNKETFLDALNRSDSGISKQTNKTVEEPKNVDVIMETSYKLKAQTCGGFQTPQNMKPSDNKMRTPLETKEEFRNILLTKSPESPSEDIIMKSPNSATRKGVRISIAPPEIETDSSTEVNTVSDVTENECRINLASEFSDSGSQRDIKRNATDVVPSSNLSNELLQRAQTEVPGSTRNNKGKNSSSAEALFRSERSPDKTVFLVTASSDISMQTPTKFSSRPRVSIAPPKIESDDEDTSEELDEICIDISSSGSGFNSRLGELPRVQTDAKVCAEETQKGDLLLRSQTDVFLAGKGNKEM